MSREHALVRAALEAAAELVDDQLYSGLAELIRSLDPAAIVCPSPFGEDDGTAADCIRRGHCGCDNDPAAVAATVPSEWSVAAGFRHVPEDVHSVIVQERDALRARVAELEQERNEARSLLSTVNSGDYSLGLLVRELRARVTELEKDTEQLRALSGHTGSEAHSEKRA